MAHSGTLPKAMLSLPKVMLGLPLFASGHDWYLAEIPNGYSVQRNGVAVSQALGHEGTKASVRNVFGTSFASHGYTWSAALCNEDTDGDGQSNGLELGDPSCNWTKGQTPTRVLDISHPGYADSTTSASADGSVASTTAAAAPSACTASSLVFDGVSYQCIQTFDGLPGSSLHWRLVDKAAGLVDLALVKDGVQGWISLGFPKNARRMVGGHAVVGKGTQTDVWDMETYDPPFTPLTGSAMRVPVVDASSGMQDGKLVLAMSNAKFGDLAQVELIFGYVSDCAWPCEHSQWGGYSVNLLTGGLVADPILPQVVFGVAFLLLCSLLLFGPCVVRARKHSRPSPFLMKPIIGQCTPVAIIIFFLVFSFVVIIAFSPLMVKVGLHEAMLGMGLAAGVSAMLPILTATKVGVHTVFGLTRELAFHVHAFFGAMVFWFGLAHGITALVDVSPDGVAQQKYLIPGVVGLLAMLVSVPPGLPHFRYDWFKTVHLLGGIGYFFSLVHMAAVAKQHITFPRVVVVVANAVTLFFFVVERARVVLTTTATKVLSVQVIEDEDGTKHVALDLQAGGFKYKPGQWARLHIPRVGPVGHPFTVVPGDVEGNIRFIIKACGRYTRRLAKADLKDAVVRVEGPYGEPGALHAAEWASVVAFVVGGVGVTPALALAPFVSSKGPPPLLYWAMRSERLFRLCSPTLASRVDRVLSHCQLSNGQGSGSPSNPGSWVPTEGLGPAPAKREVVDWLRAAGGEAKRRAATKGTPPSLYVFVCGPPKLGAGVRAAAVVLSKEQPDLEVQVHEETFTFLNF